MSNGNLSEGKCKFLKAANTQCEVVDSDGLTREYKCVPGYKCARLRRRDTDAKICRQMYSMEDGAETDDAELCQGGHHYRGTCVSVVAIKQGKSENENL